jgi:hypothetical protein
MGQRRRESTISIFFTHNLHMANRSYSRSKLSSLPGTTCTSVLVPDASATDASARRDEDASTAATSRRKTWSFLSLGAIEFFFSVFHDGSSFVKVFKVHHFVTAPTAAQCPPLANISSPRSLETVFTACSSRRNLP